jgi:hypothetical protein
MIGDQKFRLEVRNKQGVIEVATDLESYDSVVCKGLTRISKQDSRNIASLKDGDSLRIRVNEIRGPNNILIESAIEIFIRKVIVDKKGRPSSLGVVSSGETVFLEFDQDLNVLPLLSISKSIAEVTGRPPVLVNPDYE